MIGRDLFADLVAEAAGAPSVHNVQPARWAIRDDAIVLVEDVNRRLPAGDPSGRDAMVSMGSACEAMCIALSRHRFVAEVERIEAPTVGGLRETAVIRLGGCGPVDPLAAASLVRSSHRAAFDPPTDHDRSAARSLGSDDLTVLWGVREVEGVADLHDAASLVFMRDRRFRAELVSWLRLSRRHPRWSLDGLNADAMGMGRFEATGAGLVLGPAFGLLDAIGAAAGIVSDRPVSRKSVAIAVMHFPVGMDPFEIGRAFLRAWLRFEAAGFRGAVLASIVDHASSREALARIAQIPSGRSIEAVWRIGRSSSTRPPRARLGTDDLLIRGS